MNGNHPSQVNKIALIGQSGAGKTSLAEALLATSHMIERKGRVEDGNTVCDFEPEEVARHSSLSLALAAIEQGDHKLNLLDTPGLPDFIAEVEAALAVADFALVVVSAVDGVGPQTEMLWRIADELGLPRVVFVNKLDHERADFTSVLESLRATFGEAIVSLELPINAGPGFSEIADLLAEEALTYNGDGSAHHGPIPEALLDTERRVHEELVEGIVVGDDELVERYLNGSPPSATELAQTLSTGVAAGRVVPVLCGSATCDVGIDRLSEFLAGLAWHHHRVHVRAGDTDFDLEPSGQGQPLARVFKTVVDPFIGRISLLEVLSGTLHPDDQLVNARTHAEERLHVLESLLGKRATPVSEASAGDVVAVPKLHDVRVGDTLAPSGSPVIVDTIHISEPTCSIAIRARTASDEDKLMGALARLTEEDPGLRVERIDETHQVVLSGMGETHLQVALERLATKLHVATDVEELKVPYRQTVTIPAEAEGRHKKQTGGHGQFGVVHLCVEPLERGGGFEFVDAVVGGAIPRQFIPAVEKGVRRAMAQGGDLGYPVVDVKVTVDDGKFHPVDSSEASFEQAGILAFNEALRQAKPCALEPISRVEVLVPSSNLGDVLGDLNTRRGRVLSSGGDEHGDQHVVAMVPTSELVRYGIELRSLSAGRGRFRATHDHYEPVPMRVLEKKG